MKPKRYNQSALAVLRRSSRFPTLASLAAELGVRSTSQMQQIEGGRVVVSDERLRALAKALNLPLWRVEAAYLAGRRAFLRGEADRVNRRLQEVLSKAS